VGYLFDDMGRKEARYLGRRRFIHGKTPTIEFPLCTCDEDNTENATDLVNATTVEQADALTFHNIPQTAYSNQYFGAWYEHKAQMYPNGIYALDYENNRLNLDAGTDTAVGNYLVVEYKSTLNSNDYNYIPLIAFEALRAKAMELMGNQTDNWRKIYNQELNTIRAASQNITIDDVMQIVCGGRHLRFRG
jgi:hypothetical protein